VLLPGWLRARVPTRLRDDPRLRALAVGGGLIPQRAMHSPEDMAVLLATARSARSVVEIGVYEGGSAVELCAVLTQACELHLVDPFGRRPTALPAGWGATEWASRRVVARASRHGGPRVCWHVAPSAEVAAHWTEEVDLVFIDGDHSEEGCELDWLLWHEHVRLGGHVVFHDARLDQPGGRGLPGPTAVVERLRATMPAGWRLTAEADRTVALRRVDSTPL